MISQSADNQKRQEETRRDEKRGKEKRSGSGSAEIVRGSVNVDEY